MEIWEVAGVHVDVHVYLSSSGRDIRTGNRCVCACVCDLGLGKTVIGQDMSPVCPQFCAEKQGLEKCEVSWDP